MKPYPSYKPTNIEWIGDIPEHWEVLPIKRLSGDDGSLFIDGDWIESQDIVYEINEFRYITTGNIGIGTYKEQGLGYITAETFKKLNCTEVFPNDLLISRLNPPIGRCCIIPDLGKKIVTSVDNVILRPNKKFNKKFLMFVMSSGKYFEHTLLTARGATMQRISRGLLGEIKIPIAPSLEEQAAIANYLDHKTALIDTLIADKLKLIELLKEERIALVNNSVTKGISPEAKLKNSGIEWLGDIPEHWEIKKLRFLCKITTGAKNTEDRIDDGEYPFFVRSQTVERINSYSFDGEGILTAGDGVGVAKVFHYINGKFDFHQRVYLFYDFSIEISVKFLFHFLQLNLMHEVLRYNAKSTVDSLRLPMLKEFPIAFSSLIEEQNAIVQYIQYETNRIDDTIINIENELELLKEYRTALIGEVVTGKIDVRDFDTSKN